MNHKRNHKNEAHKKHWFLSTEQMSADDIRQVLRLAESFTEVSEREIKTVPLLRGRAIANLFFEDSTRTRTTFELAAKRLAADVLNINLQQSALQKGESLADTLKTLQAMHFDMFIIRHPHSGAAHFIANRIAPGIAIINAGDGCHEHPTQAMVDAYTITRHRPDLSQSRVALIGDICHSRVARSNIHSLTRLGVREVRVIGPRTLIPTDIESLGVRVFYDLASGLRDVDIIIPLRLQRERMNGVFLPGADEYYRRYGLDHKAMKHAREKALILHPGPVNRGVEIDSQTADGDCSLIWEQVRHGIAVRMAVMAWVMGSEPAEVPSSRPVAAGRVNA